MEITSLLPILAAVLLGQHAVVVPIDALAPPPVADEPPPVDALVDSVAVQVEPGPDETALALTWRLRAITPGWVDLPVTGAALAVERATLDGVPVALEPGPDGVRRLAALLDGRHELVVAGTVATPEAQLDLPLLTAARGHVSVHGGPWDVTAEDAVLAGPQDFDLVQTERLALRWRPAAPPSPRPTVITAEAAVAFRVDASGLEATAVIRHRIRYGAVDTLHVGLPAEAEEVSVEGSGVRQQRRTADGVEVQLARPVEGSATLRLSYRAPAPEGEDLATMPLPWTPDTRALWVSVLRTDEAMVAPEPARGLQPALASELPAWATGLAAGEPVATYRAAGGRPELQVRVLQYEPVEEPPTLVDEARYEIAYTSHGRVLLRARYQVRNDRNQYLHVAPPAGYDAIGARVAGVVVQPASDGDGGLFVPLEKSVESLEGLVSFPVEVLFWGDEAPWSARGIRELVAPAVDAPIAYARWEVVLPPDRVARAAVSDATLVDRWTDRDRGLTYGRAHGESLRDEEADEVPAADGKRGGEQVQIVASKARRGPPPPPAPPPLPRAEKKAPAALAASGGGAAAPVRRKADEPPAQPAGVSESRSNEASRALQEDLSVEVFNQAYSAYKANRFDDAASLLERSLELDPYNKSAAQLQSNVDVFVGSGEEAGEEQEVLSRRVRELAQAKTQGRRVEQEKRKREADQAFRAGDLAKAEEEYRRLVEVTEELAQVEQVESVEQKVQLEAFQRQLADIERQVDETRERVVKGRVALGSLDEAVVSGRSSSEEVQGVATGGGADGVADVDRSEWSATEPSGATTSISTWGFEDVTVEGELRRPAADQPASGGDEPTPEPEAERGVVDEIPDRHVRIVLDAEELQRWLDEDGRPDPDLDGDTGVDADETVSGGAIHLESAPEDHLLLDRRSADFDGLIQLRDDFDDIQLAPGEVAIVVDGDDDWADELDEDDDYGPPTEPLLETRSAHRGQGQRDGEATPPSIAVTAAALSIRVPRAGESLRFEQRLIPENTPMTVELRYRTVRSSPNRRNR